MRDLITKEGYSYAFDPTACANCGGRCCTGESGYIFVNRHEMERMANFLRIDIEELKKRYLYKEGYKYSIKERKVGESFECVFFDREAGGCSVYAARPIQCRTFPFWDHFKNNIKALKEECPGIVDAK